MSALNSPISLAELVQFPYFVFYPDDPANVDGDGNNSFDGSNPRIDGDSAANLDLILGAVLRVKSWTINVSSSTEEFVWQPGATDSDPGSYQSQGVQANGTLSADLLPIDNTPGDTEQSSYTGAFGEPSGPVSVSPYVTKQSTFDPNASCSGQIRLGLFMNGNAADGDYPVLFTFELSGGVTTQIYGQSCGAGFGVGGDYTADEYPAGEDCISFLGQTFNLQASSMGYAYQQLPPPTPGQNQQPPNYSILTVTAVEVVPKEYFTWGGVYDSSTGQPAGS